MPFDFHTQDDLRVCPNIREAFPDPTVQSQYSTSPIIKALVHGFDEGVSPVNDIWLFYRFIFDVDTARGVGLDIWGRIVGVTRHIEVYEEDYFGFLGSEMSPFDSAPFWTGKPSSYIYDLDDVAFRRLIMYKAWANISSADGYSLNQLMTALYPEKQMTIIETDKVMTIRLVVESVLEPYERGIFRQYGLFAKGAGVLFEWLEVPQPVFGFEGSKLQPFDQAPFFNGGIVTPKQ